MKPLHLYFVSELLKEGVIGTLVKLIGRVIEISAEEIVILTLSDGNAEIEVRVFDKPAGLADRVLREVSIGDYVIIIGYYKELDGEKYVVAKGVQKISQKHLEYYKLRRRLTSV